MMRALFEDLSGGAADPGQLLSQINQGLAAVFKQTGTTMFATAFYMIADIASGHMSYASAAHTPPLHLSRRHGNVERLVGELHGQKGPALGLFNEAHYPTCSRPLAEGDLLALFTDGLVEAESPRHENFSETGLMAAVQRRSHLPGGRLLAELIAEIQSFSGRSEFEDDVCLVGMEIKRLGRPA
jgi:sigma-B regulation protein RsbU (phosphoserine phosphatase)